jgi:signal peptidase II
MAAASHAHPAGVLAPATVIAANVALVDQASKTLARAHGAAGNVFHNHELSLGIAGASVPTLLALMALAVLAFGGYTAQLARQGRMSGWVPGLLIGGALSNLADRLMAGAVTDFIPVGHIVFNVADLAVILGVVLFAGSLWLGSRPQERPAYSAARD